MNIAMFQMPEWNMIKCGKIFTGKKLNRTLSWISVMGMDGQ